MLAIRVIEALLLAGVREFVICPGARNAPLANLLSSSNLSYSYWVEERSAAFFALGRARRTGFPVAVITTSGTAAGELLPAMMESYYTEVPLIAITADRPKCYRNTNAPQTAEQVGLFGIYAPLSFDLEEDDELCLQNWTKREPLHLNVCFEEPATREDPYPFKIPASLKEKGQIVSDHALLGSFLSSLKRPLVIVSTLLEKDLPGTIRFLNDLKAPVYLEGISGIRNTIELSNLRIYNPRLEDYDGVLRIGGVPTHRIWRDLTSAYKVLSITPYPFSGMTLAPFIYTDLDLFFQKIDLSFPHWDFDEEFYASQNLFQKELEALLLTYPRAEASLVNALSKRIPESAHIYLGNSLPIREWDLAATYEPKAWELTASRGLNGIDGQLSCFFGLCKENTQNLALVGDLTAMYDFAAFWGLKYVNAPFAIVIMNNGGGKIFASRFENKEIQNCHDFSFEHFGAFWKLPYQKWEELPSSLSFQGVIEIVPDPVQTEQFNKELQALRKAYQLC